MQLTSNPPKPGTISTNDFLENGLMISKMFERILQFKLLQKGTAPGWLSWVMKILANNFSQNFNTGKVDV
jgi:hypothetical protein